MNKPINKLLSQVASDALEQLTFCFVEENPNGISLSIDLMVTGSVGFKGPFNGFLEVSLPIDLLPEMAANMLGTDLEEITEQEQEDTLKEICNILCGNILPKIAGADKVFNIDTPLIRNGVGKKGKQTKPPFGDIALCLDEADCGVKLYVDPPLPEELCLLLGGGNCVN